MWIVAAVTVGLLIVGRYSMIERVSIVLVGSFTLMTAAGALLLIGRPDLFSWAGVLEGLSFHRPEGGLSSAVTVFGATGVGAAELIMYPYWCIEKGYARFTGAHEEGRGWSARASGWIGVMGIDVLTSLGVYTFATVAFYLLGAGVLHGLGVVPEGADLIQTLANMYTETLGGWSYYLFLVGAVAVLYSTIFAVTAGNSRLFADFFGMMGWLDWRDHGARLRFMRVAVVVLLLVPVMNFFYLREPVVMVKISGTAQALMLPIIGFATIYLLRQRLPASIAPKGWIRLALWATSGAMAAMMAYSLVQSVG